VLGFVLFLDWVCRRGISRWNKNVGGKPMDVKSKMIERKLRSGKNWQGALKQKGAKQG
jgi:hypothetical protein